jgi:hypothetical protein
MIAPDIVQLNTSQKITPNRRSAKCLSKNHASIQKIAAQLNTSQKITAQLNASQKITAQLNASQKITPRSFSSFSSTLDSIKNKILFYHFSSLHTCFYMFLFFAKYLLRYYYLLLGLYSVSSPLITR